MELRQLEVVVAIDEAGTLSAAATRLHLVQSAVSSTLAGLERELGAALFERTPRRAVPTDAGRALLAVARELLALAARAGDVVDEASGGLRGTLTVGTMTSHEPIDLPALLGAFVAERPQVTVALRAVPEGTSGLVRAVAAGDLDVCFASLTRGTPAGVQSWRLAATPMRLLLPPAHPLAAADEVALADLSDERWIDGPEGFGNRALVDDAFSRAGVVRQVGLEITEMGTAPRYVAAGLGPAVMPSFVPARGLPSPRLVGPGSDDLAWPVDLVAAVAGRRRAVTQAFVETVLGS